MPQVPDKLIKSAERVLDVFELFDESRQAVTVMEVARALNAPQSSTSELLASLVRRGYLAKDRNSRCFRPTARVALLGAWVHPQLFRQGDLLPMMDDLACKTGMGVALCCRIGVKLKHIHTVGEMPHELSTGAEPNLLSSPFGQVLLSTMYSEDVRLLVHRINAESSAGETVRPADLQATLIEVSKAGVAMGDVGFGCLGLSVLAPRSADEEQMSLGLIGPADQVASRRNEILRDLRQAISASLGPRVVSETDEAMIPQRSSGYAN